MTLKRIEQGKKSLRDNIVAILISLRDTNGLSNREISRLIGVNENYLSRVFNRDAAGSLQLLRGLEMLLELQTRKVIVWPDMETEGKTEARARGAGVPVPEFAGLCLALFGAETADAIVTARFEEEQRQSERPELNERPAVKTSSVPNPVLEFVRRQSPRRAGAPGADPAPEK